MTARQELLTQLYAAAMRQGEFFLPDGHLLQAYFDEFALASDPALLRSVAENMCKLLPPTSDVLVGLELGGIAITVAMSAASGLPAAFLRRTRKTYGSRRQIEGRQVAGAHAVLIDDVARSGHQLELAVAVVRAHAADISVAVTVLDRCLGAADRLAETVGVQLRCLASVPD